MPKNKIARRAVIALLSILALLGWSIIIEGPSSSPAHAAGSDGTGTISLVHKVNAERTTTGTSLQTGTFTDANVTDTTFLALVMTADSGTSPNNSVSSITSTGSGCATSTLNWTLAKRTNVQWGTAEVWWGRNIGGGSIGGTTACRVTANWTEATYGSVGVSLVKNTDMSAPVTTSANSASGQPKVSVTTGAGDLAMGIFQDYTGSQAKTALTGQSKTYEYAAASGDTYTAVQVDSHTAGTFDVGVTQTARKFNGVGVVLKPKPVGGGDTTAPSAPANLVATGTTDTSTNLAWDPSTDNVSVTGYRVFKDGSAVSGDVTSGTSKAITGLTASTAYSFTVKAFDAAGNLSAASSALPVTTSATPDTTAPTTPGTASASGTTSTGTTLSWGTSTDSGGSGLAGYQVYKGGAAEGTLVPAGTTTKTVGGLSPSTAYAFTVKAKDNAGNSSAASNTVNVTTSAGAVVNCMASPHICSFPDETNTGPVLSECGGSLTTVNGDVHLSTASENYNCKQVNGDIYVEANNVTIKNVKVVGASYYNIRVGVWTTGISTTGLLVQQSEVDMQGFDDGKAIASQNYTLDKVYIHNGADCAHFDGTVEIENSYCILGPDGATAAQIQAFCDLGSHIDGFQTDGGSNFYLHDNTIKNPCYETSGFLDSTNTGAVTNLRFNHNLAAGGGYTLYCAGDDSSAPSGTVEMKDNRIARTLNGGAGYFSSGGNLGPWAHCSGMPANSVTGNVWDDDNSANNP